MAGYRPTWQGHLRLSLVTCPVALYTATNSGGEVHFNLINPETNTLVHQPQRKQKADEWLARSNPNPPTFKIGCFARPFLTDGTLWNRVFTPDGKNVISTNGLSNDITFIDTESDEPIKSVTVGALPWGVTVAPN